MDNKEKEKDSKGIRFVYVVFIILRWLVSIFDIEEKENRDFLSLWISSLYIRRKWEDDFKKNSLVNEGLMYYKSCFLGRR